MTIEDWQAIGIVSGALLAVLGLILLAAKGLSRLWQWRFGDEIKATMERIEARMKRDMERLEARMERFEEKLDDHVLEAHERPPARPAKAAPGRPNGPQPRYRP